jgi:lysozyme family protein
MAVRIPQYEDRLTPSGFVTPRAQGVEVTPALGRAIENLGDAGVRFAGVEIANQRREQEKADAEFKQQEEERLRKLEAKQQADAVTEAGKRVSSANLEFQTWYNTAAKNPGENFAEQVKQKWTELSTRTLDGSGDEQTRLQQAQAGQEPDYGIRHSAARTNAERSLTQLGEHYISNAIGVEAKAGVARRLDNLETTVSDNERAVGADPSLFDKLRTDTLSVIQNDPTLDVETKIRTARQSSDRLTIAALQGAVARGESTAVKSAIMKRLGANALSSEEEQAIIATGNQPPASSKSLQAGPDPKSVQGLVTPGNIDLTNRPQVKNKDGSISTVSSFSVNVDGKEVLLTPIAENGKVLSEKEAIEKYKKDGKHLGIFDTPAAASAYAEQLHQFQDRFYNRGKTGGGAGGFNQAVAFTLKAEGGYNPKDANGSPVNFGINQAANPDVDVKNLTKEKAAEIYKERYWNKIGGDELAAKNPALATIAFDTAVIAGVGKGKELLAKADGDPTKLMQLRKEFLASLVQKNPEKYGRFEKAWNNRNAQLESLIAGGGAAAGNTQESLGNVTVQPEADPTMMSIVDRLPQDKLIPMLHSAQTAINQQQSAFQSSLKATETDHMAAFANGDQVPKLLTEGQYKQAYGPAEGSQRYAEYQRAQQLGIEINAVRTMTVEQQRVVLEGHNPVPGSPGYAIEMQRKQVLQQAIDRVNEARGADPMAYQMSVVKMGNVKPIDWNNGEQTAAELANRVGVAYTNAQNFGSPLMLLTKQEASNLAAGMNNMSAQEKLRYLGVIRSSVKDQAAYRSVLQQIAPDSVVTSMAGIITTKEGSVIVPRTFGADDSYQPQQVAQLMLEGEAILNPTKTAAGQDGKGGKYPLPKESDFMAEFNNQVGNTFAGNPGAASAAMQGVKAYYVGKAAREGDLSDVINGKRMQEAINAVTGGVSDINGSNVIRPWGMPEDIFKDRAKIAFDGTIKGKGMVASYGGVTLQNYGDGTYLVRSGTDFLRGPDGAPVIIDVVSGAPAAPANARTVSTNPGKTKEPAPAKLKTR